MLVRIFKRASACVAMMLVMCGLLASAQAVDIVVEGEFFKPLDDKGWAVTHQDDSSASHSYGGMWVSNGGLLGAPGEYRVWSKYQAPPYFHYSHRIEIVQGGKTVYTHDYGAMLAPKFFSFSGAYKMGPIKHAWWFWGVDHDAAEAPRKTVNLAKGPAEVRLISIDTPAPAGDAYIDFIVLTTTLEDTYEGHTPYQTGSPFVPTAIKASRLYMRFRNTTSSPAQVRARTAGHMQPRYDGQNGVFPAQPVAPGQWSEWFNIASICRLVHEEGVWLSVDGATTFDVEVARDPAGKDIVGRMNVQNGEAVVIPIDVLWKDDAQVMTSREHAQRIIELSKSEWRTANNGKKPSRIAYYGAFREKAPWGEQLKDALGYNTQLSGDYEHLPIDGYHQHTHNEQEIRRFIGGLSEQQKKSFRILSFGDEIHLGSINYNDPDNQTKFQAWLKRKGYTKADLGVDPSQATLTKDGDPRLVWYSNLFNEEERFAVYAANTRLAEELMGSHLLTGANYSPHPTPQYYGPIYQWVDIFKHRGMTAYWAEDYIFSVPESPQIIDWMFATMRCAVKYHDLPMHFYVMPHAPGQEWQYLRKSMVFAIGAGAAHIDNFWVAPAENFTENSIAWKYTDSFRVIHESIYDSGEVEHISIGGKERDARIAIVLSKATDFNEAKVKVQPSDDPFVAMCERDFGLLEQTICRKDQQHLFIALRNAGYEVDLITEDDINEGVNGKDILGQYQVIYFAGEWIENHAAKKLDTWVQRGGVLYATAGLGHRNQYNQPETALLDLLGLKSVTVEKSHINLRPLLELPLAEPIGTITYAGKQVHAVGMKQVLTPDEAKVIGTWGDGSAAVTIRNHGQGVAYAVGTLAGHTFFKTGTRPVPWARGGRSNLYTPQDFDEDATNLVLLGALTRQVGKEWTSSSRYVQALILDNTDGTLVSLVNWDNKPIEQTTVSIQCAFKPRQVWSVQQQKALDFEYRDKAVIFTTRVDEADYIILRK